MIFMKNLLNVQTLLAVALEMMHLLGIIKFVSIFSQLIPKHRFFVHFSRGKNRLL